MAILFAYIGLLLSVLLPLSYKHYKSYQKLFFTLFPTIFVLLFVSIGWNDVIGRMEGETIAVIQSNELGIELLKTGIVQKVSAVFLPYNLNTTYILIGFIITGFILLLLFSSPHFISDHPYNRKGKNTTND